MCQRGLESATNVQAGGGRARERERESTYPAAEVEGIWEECFDLFLLLCKNPGWKRIHGQIGQEPRLIMREFSSHKTPPTLDG